jgi:hypothetical protein
VLGARPTGVRCRAGAGLRSSPGRADVWLLPLTGPVLFMPVDVPAAGDADTEGRGAGSACRSGCRPPAPRTQSTPMVMPPSVSRIKISCHQLPLPPIANLMRPRAAMTAPRIPMCASTLELPYLAVPPSVGRPGEQERGTGWGSPGVSFPVSFPGVALPVQTRPAPARECGARARSSIIIRRPVAGRVSHATRRRRRRLAPAARPWPCTPHADLGCSGLTRGGGLPGELATRRPAVWAGLLFPG